MRNDQTKAPFIVVNRNQIKDLDNRLVAGEPPWMGLRFASGEFRIP